MIKPTVPSGKVSMEIYETMTHRLLHKINVDKQKKKKT